MLKFVLVWLHCIPLQVIEKAEILRDMDSNLLPVLLRLQELVRTGCMFGYESRGTGWCSGPVV